MKPFSSYYFSGWSVWNRENWTVHFHLLKEIELEQNKYISESSRQTNAELVVEVTFTLSWYSDMSTLDLFFLDDTLDLTDLVSSPVVLFRRAVAFDLTDLTSSSALLAWRRHDAPLDLTGLTSSCSMV